MANEKLLNCYVLKAKYLPKKDRFSKTDGFVRVHCGSDEQKTDVIQNDYHPEWNKRMTFHENFGPDDIIKIVVYDKDTFGEDLIGYAGIKYGENPSQIGLKIEDFNLGVDVEYDIWQVDDYDDETGEYVIKRCRNKKKKHDSSIRIRMEEIPIDAPVGSVPAQAQTQVQVQAPIPTRRRRRFIDEHGNVTTRDAQSHPASNTTHSPPSNAPAPPPPPPSTRSTSKARPSGGRAALLAGIQGGVNLKKVKDSEKKDRSSAVTDRSTAPSQPTNPMAAALLNNPRFKGIQRANGH